MQDRISHSKGIVIGITDWLYGCRRVVVQGETEENGKPVDPFTLDEPQVVVVDKGIIQIGGVKKVRPGGPREDPKRHADPPRGADFRDVDLRARGAIL